MTKTLHINVTDKVATYRERDGVIVCGNNDYVIEFTFDDEWDGYNSKTARFIWNNNREDVTFTGTTCPVPVIENATECVIGVYVEGVCSTTSVVVDCLKSIRCGS